MSRELEEVSVRLRTVRGMSRRRGWCSAAAGAAVVAAALASPSAMAATNLITNPGFEAQGAAATVFADSLPDLTAWSQTSGGFTDSGGKMVPNGAAATSDTAVVSNSGDYRDGTYQAQGIPLTLRAGLKGGLVFRYRDPSDFYGCVVTQNSLQLMARVGGTDTALRTAAMSVQAGLAGWLRVTMSGSNLTCAAYANSGGAPGQLLATVTATDARFTDGSIGVFDTNTSTTAGAMLDFTLPTMSAVLPASWSAPVLSAGRPGEVPDMVATPTGGSESMQVFGGSPAFDGYSQQTGISVTGATSYTLQAEIKTASVAGAAQVVAVESPGGTQTVLGNVSGTTPWTLYTTTFTTQPGTTSVAIRTRLQGSGTANVDDLSLSLTPTVGLALSTASLNLGTVSPLSSPFAYPSAVTATVTASAGWTLKVSGSGPFSDGTGKSIPLSELAWRLAGTGVYTPFSTTPATVSQSTTTTPIGGTAIPLDYQLTIGYSDSAYPSPFSTTITYVATTP